MGQRADIAWREGDLPVSVRFDDPYFSVHDGLAETRHTFLGGNGLPERFRDGFRIAELGFGTGLNLLATVAAWQGAGRFSYTSFEAFPMSAQEMARALGAFPGLAFVDELVRGWAGGRRFAVGPADVTVLEGDARALLPAWEGRADAWYLDGFAPARNPELWEPALMQAVAAHTAPDGTFATYTAAGEVRRSLAEAGFEVERVPGYGRKRHMTKGRLKDAG